MSLPRPYLTLQENGENDLFYSSNTDANCQNQISNITGSGRRPIEFYNYSINLSNQIFSELILCNADGSNLTNITIQGSDSLRNNGLFLERNENSNITNINFPR